MKTKTTVLALLFAACASQSHAQTFDSSGDSQLNGTYYFRQVAYFVADESGDLGEAMNVQGTITFNGSGGYNINNASFLDSASGSATPVTFSNVGGTYAISASGEGYITSVNPDFTSDQIIGLVSHVTSSSPGIFIGSTTETGNGYNDLFIATPISSSPPTNATLNGSYTVAYFDPTYTSSTGATGGDALFTMSPNGSGNIGTVNITGYLGDTDTASTQSLSGVTYSFSNGAAQINFGGSTTNLIGGTELLYVSPDGNFVFGGSYNYFDMFVGVRGGTSTPSNYDGLYYQAGLDLDEAPLSQGYTLLDSYFGSLQAFTQNIIGDQRINALLEYGGSADYTYYDSYQLSGNGGSTDEDFDQSYVSSADSSIRIGYGIGPYLGLNVALKAPYLSGSGVYLNPTGMVNAASSAPFTAFLSPGEMLSLYGTSLAPGNGLASTVPLPTNLNGVQVLINQQAVPIVSVGANQISVIVPWEIANDTVAQIQVINNGVNSNVVTQFIGTTSVGVFTYNPVGGIGYAAALRPDNSLISDSNPAQINETEAVYLTGMGTLISNEPVDGGPGPSTSQTTQVPQVYIYDSAGNEAQATVAFSGLAPGFAGLYQINITIPTGLASGDATLDVYSGDDSESVEALLPIGSATSARPRALATSHVPLVRHRLPAGKLRLSGKPPLSLPLRSQAR